MFQGSSGLALDAKGRMTVPVRHRDTLAQECQGRLTVTRHPDGCLLLFPQPTWELQREKFAALPVNARAWARIFLGSATDVEMDGAGRILISPELRSAAGLNRDLMLLGMGSHFEIWDAETLAAHERAVIAGGMPESVANLSF